VGYFFARPLNVGQPDFACTVVRIPLDFEANCAKIHKKVSIAACRPHAAQLAKTAQ
jgi:hypothetical protein